MSYAACAGVSRASRRSNARRSGVACAHARRHEHAEAMRVDEERIVQRIGRADELRLADARVARLVRRRSLADSSERLTMRLPHSIASSPRRPAAGEQPAAQACSARGSAAAARRACDGGSGPQLRGRGTQRVCGRSSQARVVGPIESEQKQQLPPKPVAACRAGNTGASPP